MFVVLYSPSNAQEKKWNKTGGEGYNRGFCQFVLDPIFKVPHTHTHTIYTPVKVCSGAGMSLTLSPLLPSIDGMDSVSFQKIISRLLFEGSST